MNRATIMGTLGRDPELNYTGGGTPVLKMSLATTRYGKDKGGKKTEETQWHNIVVWGKPAETAAKYLVKGMKALVEGEIQYRKYTNKEGVEKHVTEIHSWSQVEFIGGHKPVQQEDAWQPNVAAIDDIPF